MQFTDDHEMFRMSLRNVFAREIVPNFEAWERDDIFPAHDLFATLGQAGVFGIEDMIPLPCNPDQICIAYGLRRGRNVVPVTQLLPREQILSAAPNSISFERDPVLKAKIYDLL